VILIHIGTACKMRMHRISVHASLILTFIFETPGDMDVELWFMNSDQNHFYIYLLGSLHYSAWKALANWKQKPFEIQYLILNYSNTKRKYNSASINFNELCIHSVYLDKKNMISYLCLVNFFRWAVDSIGLDPMNNNKEAVKLLPRFDRTGSFIRWTKLRTELQLKKKNQDEKNGKDIPCESHCFSSKCTAGMFQKSVTRETRRKSWQEIQPCEELMKQTQILAYICTH
jgi:hypothetical protein